MKKMQKKLELSNTFNVINIIIFSILLMLISKTYIQNVIIAFVLCTFTGYLFKSIILDYSQNKINYKSIYNIIFLFLCISFAICFINYLDFYTDIFQKIKHASPLPSDAFAAAQKNIDSGFFSTFMVLFPFSNILFLISANIKKKKNPEKKAVNKDNFYIKIGLIILPFLAFFCGFILIIMTFF